MSILDRVLWYAQTFPFSTLTIVFTFVILVLSILWMRTYRDDE